MNNASTLALSIVNDSASYQERISIARECLGLHGLEEHAKMLGPIVVAQANVERRQFGSTFNAAAIKAACLEVAEHDREEQMNNIMHAASVEIHGRRWFQRSYGNTYNTVAVFVDNKWSFDLPKEYGYGDFWMQRAKEFLERVGFAGCIACSSVRDVARERDL